LEKESNLRLIYLNNNFDIEFKITFRIGEAKREDFESILLDKLPDVLDIH